MPGYPGANRRSFQFLLEGLGGVEKRFDDAGIGFLTMIGDPPSTVAGLSKGAAAVVMDEGYLRHQQAWYREVSLKAPCLAISVESNVIVPVRKVSSKVEYSAATIRPKVHRHLMDYLDPVPDVFPEYEAGDNEVEGYRPVHSLYDLPGIADAEGRPSPSLFFHGGTQEALRRFSAFLSSGLDRYHETRNDPVSGILSHMSPYLHFGQVSPVFLARKAIEAGSPGTEAFIEELVVRRELAMNYALYNPSYDRYEGIPAWARRSLESHRSDPRRYLYSFEEFDRAETHDPYWNAAQDEMRICGKMHAYMRMYWGKKILEWSATPEEAFKTAVALNDRYELDGRDPNGYAGIAWCFGTHDRPWKERPVFGMVRYMNESGLRRKFDADAYVEKVKSFGSRL
jgi:deoxyribodipyrimidine photo-lyase